MSSSSSFYYQNSPHSAKLDVRSLYCSPSESNEGATLLVLPQDNIWHYIDKNESSLLVMKVSTLGWLTIWNADYFGPLHIDRLFSYDFCVG